MQKEDGHSKYFFIAILILAAALSLMVVLPFLTSIVTGAILAFIFNPLFTRILGKVKSRSIAAFITAIMILLLITIPVVLLVNNLTKETHDLYTSTKEYLGDGELVNGKCDDPNIICRTVNRVNKALRDDNVKTYLVARLNDFIGWVTKRISNVILSLPKLVIHFLVILFTTYYLLKDGQLFLKRFEKVAPLKVHHQEKILKQFKDVIHAVVYGSFIVALVQGTLGAFGFWVFGIKSFVWWGIIMTFFALIPFVGTWVVWMPASAYLGLTGYLQADTTIMWMGVGLFFYGLLIISTIDNFLKPLIVAGRARVHPLLILIGILGGLFVFGLIGLIIGPLILAMMQTLLEIYEKERKQHVYPKEEDILGHKDSHSKKRRR